MANDRINRGPTKLLRQILSLRSNQHGSAAVDLAFVLPVMLLFILGIIECGRAVWTNYSLQTAVEDTARYILANPLASDPQITTYVGNKLDLLDSSKITITVTRESVSGVNFVSVSAAYSLSVLTMIFPDGDISLIGSSRIALTAPPT